MEQSKYERIYVNEIRDEVYKQIMSNTIGVCNHNNNCNTICSHIVMKIWFWIKWKKQWLPKVNTLRTKERENKKYKE